MTRRRRRASPPWPAMMWDSSLLCADASMVMAIRSIRMMTGGAEAAIEAERMVGEKIAAGLELAGALASGRVTSPEAAARKALAIYGKRVRANRKRLG